MTWFMLSTLLGTVLAPFTGLINKFLHSVNLQCVYPIVTV